MAFDRSVLDTYINEEVGTVIDEIQPVGQPTYGVVEVSQNGELTVDISKVYGELNNLVTTAKDLLETAKFIMENDTTGESIGGVASMINTVRQLVKEFSSIHTQNLKFEQAKEMEMLKQANRERLIRMRNPQEEEETNDGETVTLREYNQEDMIMKIMKMKKANS